MDIVEVINQRRSIRAFKPDSVPQGVLKEIMELSLRAPSWGNIQPWEFAIVGGEKLEEIRQAYIVSAEGQQPSSEVPAPQTFPQPFDARRRALGIKLFEVKGIKREDKEKRRLWQLQGLRLFEAPCAIYIYVDRALYFQANGLNAWPLFDCGLIAENIMLLAANHGLGTIAQIQAVHYPGALRKILGIPDYKLIVLGIAIGYPNWDDPVNQFRSERESLDKVAKWYGF